MNLKKVLGKFVAGTSAMVALASPVAARAAEQTSSTVKQEIFTPFINMAGQTFKGFVGELSANKKNSSFIKEKVDQLLKKADQVYDYSGHYGRIGSSSQEAFNKIVNAPYETEVKNNICGPGHQLAADTLNAAGINARVVSAGASSPHYVLVYELPGEKGKYVVNNYGESKEFSAKNFQKALELAPSKSPSIIPSGVFQYKDANGENTFRKLAVPLPEQFNPDKNTPANLNAPFTNLKEKPGVDFRTSTNSGKDDIFGDYTTKSGQASYAGTKHIDGKLISDLDYKVTGDYSNLNAKSSDAEQELSKEASYNLLGIRAESKLNFNELSLSKNPAKDSSVTLQPFVSGKSGVYGILGKGTITHNRPDSLITPNTKKCVSSDLDVDLGVYPGATLKINNGDTTGNVTAYTGARAVLNTNVFEQILPAVQPESVSGIQAGIEHKGNLTGSGKWKYKVGASASDVQVISPGLYNLNSASVDAKAELKRCTSSEVCPDRVYGNVGVNVTNTNIKGIGKSTDTKPSGTIGYERNLGKTRIGVEGGTYGPRNYGITGTFRW